MDNHHVGAQHICWKEDNTLIMYVPLCSVQHLKDCKQIWWMQCQPTTWAWRLMLIWTAGQCINIAYSLQNVGMPVWCGYLPGINTILLDMCCPSVPRLWQSHHNSKRVCLSVTCRPAHGHVGDAIVFVWRIISGRYRSTRGCKSVIDRFRANEWKECNGYYA